MEKEPISLEQFRNCTGTYDSGYIIFWVGQPALHQQIDSGQWAQFPKTALLFVRQLHKIWKQAFKKLCLDFVVLPVLTKHKEILSLALAVGLLNFLTSKSCSSSGVFKSGSIWLSQVTLCMSALSWHSANSYTSPGDVTLLGCGSFSDSDS